MTEEVKGYIAKAEHALEVAEELMKKGYAPDAASKIYYSMFYAAQALLKSEGIDVLSTRRLNPLWVITLPSRGELIRNIIRC